MTDFQTCIIGAGVVGLAVAAELAARGDEVIVLEQAKSIGSETSSRNSEVIHAGIYYPKGSLKAQLCVEGKKLLYDHCNNFHIPFSKIGKWIVATNPSQLESLASIKQRAQANGVNDLEYLDEKTSRSTEIDLNCIGALNSPSTGIIDSHAFMVSLQGILEALGNHIAFDTQVTSMQKSEGEGFSVQTTGGNGSFCFTTRNLVLCAGLHTSPLLHTLGNSLRCEVPETRFAKGHYFKLNGKAPFRRLVYPVPEPGGLGVHLTLDLNRQARFGPDVEWIDRIDYEVAPQQAEKFYAAIRKYWPALPDNALQPDYAGIRPKLAGPGEKDGDFLILDESSHGMKGFVALMGIESPGLTASLALAKYTAQFL